MAKISIVLPTYNGEKWLAEAIQSVISQTERDWELIIVDDGSIDSTLEISQKFSESDKRIMVVSNRENKKLPASLNIGFRLARGKYFTWTSDDNTFKPDALKIMGDYLDKHSEIDLVCMNQDCIDEQGKLKFVYDPAFFKYKRNASYLIDHCNTSAAFLYRKTTADIVGDYDEGTFCAEDYDYFCRIALCGNVAYTSDNIYSYRYHSNSLTTKQERRARKRSVEIKRKYAASFFRKYAFTRLDQAKFWYNCSRKHRPPRYVFYYMFFGIQKKIVAVSGVVLRLCGLQKLGLSERFKLVDVGRYSFSKKNGDTE